MHYFHNKFSLFLDFVSHSVMQNNRVRPGTHEGARDTSWYLYNDRFYHRVTRLKKLQQLKQKQKKLWQSRGCSAFFRLFLQILIFCYILEIYISKGYNRKQHWILCKISPRIDLVLSGEWKVSILFFTFFKGINSLLQLNCSKCIAVMNEEKRFLCSLVSACIFLQVHKWSGFHNYFPVIGKTLYPLFVAYLVN